ncbi:phage major capsid protein [Oenococcus oeni]
MNTINELQVAWENSGQAVSDAQNKQMKMAIQNAAEPGKFSDEELSAVKKDVEDKVKARDFAKDALDGARANAKVIKPDKINGAPAIQTQDKKKMTKDEFVSNFKDILRHPNRYENMLTSSTSDDSSAGLTIPQDIETDIHTLMRQYASLEPLVNVENVSTQTGTRVIESFIDITPADKQTDQNTDAVEGTYPAAHQISYNVADYIDLFYAANSLLNDSSENVLAWLEQHIARKSVVTRNNAIISQLSDVPNKPTIASYDDIIDTIMSLDTALLTGSSVLMNKSGFTKLRKVKDANGDYLLQRDVSQQGSWILDGAYPITYVEDRWLPSAGTAAAPVFPFYFGNYKQLITIFDRQALSIDSSTQTEQAFKRNQTALRSIERFDTKTVDDDAVAAASFTAIADQPAKIVVSSAS